MIPYGFPRWSCILLLAAGLLPGAGHAFTVPGSVVFTEVSVATNDLVYDRNGGRILASVPGIAGASLGNRLAAIDPATRSVSPSGFIGSEPGRLAVSSDGTSLYVALNGAGAIRRVDVSTLAPGLQFSMGSDPFNGTLFADDLKVVPGDNNTVVTSLRNIGFSPRHEGVARFENGVKSPLVTPRHTGSNVIAFGNDPGTLFGYNNETSEFGFRTMTVSDAGIAVSGSQRTAITGFGTEIQFANGRMYASNGRVIDPATGALIGTYLFPGGSLSSKAFLADPESGLTYFVDSFRDLLLVYDMEQFVLLAQHAIPGMNGFSPTSLITAGSGQLAFRTESNELFIVSEIPEPATWMLLMAGVAALTFMRSRGPSRGRPRTVGE